MEEGACAASPSLRRSRPSPRPQPSGRAARRPARRRTPTRSRTTARSRSTCGRPTTRIPGRSRSSRRSQPRSTKKYPNVTINLKFYSLTSYLKIIKLALNSSYAPDVAEGNQGFGIDSAAGQGEADHAARQVRQEVRLGQVLLGRHGAAVPLDARRQDLRQGQPLGRRASSASRPASSTTRRCSRSTASIRTTCRRRSPASTSCSPSCARRCRASEPLIELGNKDGYESLHDFGMVQGAYVTGQFMRNWIFHAPGSDFDTPANIKALTMFQKWFKDGYFGNDYNARRRERRRGGVRQGQGRLLPRRQLAGRRSSRPASRATSGS